MTTQCKRLSLRCFFEAKYKILQHPAKKFLPLLTLDFPCGSESCSPAALHKLSSSSVLTWCYFSSPLYPFLTWFLLGCSSLGNSDKPIKSVIYKELPLQGVKVSECSRNDISLKLNIKGLKVLWMMFLSGLCYLRDPEVEKSPFLYLEKCLEKWALETTTYSDVGNAARLGVLSVPPKSLLLFPEAGKISFPSTSGNVNLSWKWIFALGSSPAFLAERIGIWNVRK